MERAREPMRVAVLASGGGSNLQALIDHLNGARSAAARVALVSSDREGAGALGRAERAGIPSRVVPVAGRHAADVARDTLELFEEHRIELVALAGYLKLVPGEVVRRFGGRIVNVHPALLPAFGGPGFYGQRVHQAVLDSGATVTGPTVHLVDEEYDRGRILAQWPVPVLPGDNAATLAARVLAAEHVLYPAVIEWLARGAPGRAGQADLGTAAGFRLTDHAPGMDEVRRALGLAQNA